MIIGVPKETFPNERRVALVPSVIGPLVKNDHEIVVESGAGLAAGLTDDEYTAKGARLADRKAIFAEADIICQVRGLGSNPEAGRADLELFKKGQRLAAMMDPLANPKALDELAKKGVDVLAMELIPRTTKAQSMDVLSSMATVAGYMAVLRAAQRLPKFFPMFMTAAGTIKPAKVFVLGAGVAGLQAIATAKRLGAVVSAYDTRPVVKEQVESLGGKFVEFELETAGSQDAGGYAKAQSEDFYKKQQELMAAVVAEHDVVITTAAVPGKKSPILVTTPMVEGMHPGSVIVDLAAEKGGNCDLTRAGEIVDHGGVQIDGPINLATELPTHASQMYGKNVVTLLQYLIKDGKLEFDMEDEIAAGTLATKDGQVIHPMVVKALEEEN